MKQKQNFFQDMNMTPKRIEYQNIWACSYNFDFFHMTVIHTEHTKIEKQCAQKTSGCSTAWKLWCINFKRKFFLEIYKNSQ